MEKFHMFGSQPGPLSSHMSAQEPSLELFDLPDRHITEAIMDSYFCSSWRLIYPVLDPRCIRETIEAAYRPSNAVGWSHLQLSAKACVLAALAMMSQLKVWKERSCPFKGDVYASLVQNRLMQILSESNLENLQTVLMLVGQTSSPLLYTILIDLDASKSIGH